MAIPPINSTHLQSEFEWLKAFINDRLSNYADEKALPLSFEYFVGLLPSFEGPESEYSKFVQEKNLKPEERTLLIVALAPHIYPYAFVDLADIKRSDGSPLFEVGGVRQKHSNAFIPTAETVLFLLAGTNIQDRFRYMKLFDPAHPLFAGQSLEMRISEPFEPVLSAVITPSQELIQSLTTGNPYKPAFGPDFPAKEVSTSMDWSDLVLEEATLRQLRDMRTWLHHGQTVLNNSSMKKRLKPGYRALFYGPPGTGKTLTAAILGKETGREVFRVDLSTVVSKYIGETEKNLERIFSRAEHRNWILFFDEADAIFGKRTQVKDSHDRFANQEVSYLLQRVEDFDGLVILASNNKDNIDEAFARRFQSIIHFPLPKEHARFVLWKTTIPEEYQLEPSIDLSKIAERFEVTGANILEVVRYCLTEAASRGSEVILKREIEEGLKREFNKMGRLYQ